MCGLIPWTAELRRNRAIANPRQRDEGESFALAATDVVPGASGRATVEETGSGLSISLSVDGLPPAVLHDVRRHDRGTRGCERHRDRTPHPS